jgi:hypothetical protein
LLSIIKHIQHSQRRPSAARILCQAKQELVISISQNQSRSGWFSFLAFLEYECIHLEKVFFRFIKDPETSSPPPPPPSLHPTLPPILSLLHQDEPPKYSKFNEGTNVNENKSSENHALKVFDIIFFLNDLDLSIHGLDLSDQWIQIFLLEFWNKNTTTSF